MSRKEIIEKALAYEERKSAYKCGQFYHEQITHLSLTTCIYTSVDGATQSWIQWQTFVLIPNATSKMALMLF